MLYGARIPEACRLSSLPWSSCRRRTECPDCGIGIDWIDGHPKTNFKSLKSGFDARRKSRPSLQVQTRALLAALLLLPLLVICLFMFGRIDTFVKLLLGLALLWIVWPWVRSGRQPDVPSE